MKVNGVIVGAGIIGSALAYELSRLGVTDLHVIDPDLEGGLSSTERNAGGVRHLWNQPINIELSRASISLFETIRNEIGFQQTGYLWLYSKEREVEARKLLHHTKKSGLSYSEWSPSQITEKYPFIDHTGDLCMGIYGPKDGLINSNSLKNFYRNTAKAKGVTFHDRTAVLELVEERKKPRLVVGKVSDYDTAETFLVEGALKKEATTEWNADFVVLCVGAWTSRLLKNIVSDPLVKPVRRQIAMFKAEDFDMTPYGMVVDTSGVYFHPEGGNILGGLVLKKESPGFRFDLDPDFFEAHLWPSLFERSSKFERLRFLNGWGGLYSYTPDTSGILGKIPGFSSLYESHSFTGRGVMQSYGAAIAMAELLTRGRFSTIDAGPLSRERFSRGPGALLPEGLHI